MSSDRVLESSAVSMTLALVLMLVALWFPSPRTIGAFLGMGLPLALVSIVLFLIYVVRDLHARRVL
ncbi:MAG TPA: hypothetical protein VKA21_07715 [Candidatus Binatia bacterium]|nr:hypothetical protein [Candidatus Binatia bacterium]